MAKVRVLVVEDSLTVRRRVCEILAADPAIEVVGEADDGAQAASLCAALRPNVVTLDMVLRSTTGLDATRLIMADCPTPILIVSSSLNRGELFHTYEALAAGAVDVLEKPRGDELGGAWEKALRAAVLLVARVRVITRPRGLQRALGRQPALAKSPPHVAGRAPCRIAALGASTGGPGALVEVLRAIPAPFCAPVLFVLHIAETFSLAFAEWLSGQTRHRVSCARGGERVAELGGRVMMAPCSSHMEIVGGALHLSAAPERHGCRPSIDVLFESLARECAGEVAAALLTGMGRDGAAGLLAIRRRGGFTVAQDEATSVVYGMPREAARLEAAERVLPLREIGPALAERVGTAGKASR